MFCFLQEEAEDEANSDTEPPPGAGQEPPPGAGQEAESVARKEATEMEQHLQQRFEESKELHTNLEAASGSHQEAADGLDKGQQLQQTMQDECQKLQASLNASEEAESIARKEATELDQCLQQSAESDCDQSDAFARDIKVSWAFRSHGAYDRNQEAESLAREEAAEVEPRLQPSTEKNKEPHANLEAASENCQEPADGLDKGQHRQQTAPRFADGAKGLPSDWNAEAALTWCDRVSRKFRTHSATNEVQIDEILSFLEQRLDAVGQPVVRKLGHPEAQSDGWIRFELLDLGREELASLENAGWVRAWHGCRLEALYCILYQGRLAESSDRSRGERHLDGAPGVYLHQDKTRGKAEGYSPKVDLCGSGVFWSAMFETRVNREDKVRVPRRTDQWVQRARSVKLVALWVFGSRVEDLRAGDSVQESWVPDMEANPFSEAWAHKPQLDDEATGSLGEELEGAERWVCREALARETPYLEMRDQGGWRDLYCVICGKWANDSHLQCASHIYRAKRPQEYRAVY